MNHLDKQTRLAMRLRSLSLKRWGPKGEVTLLGRHDAFRAAQQRLRQFAAVDRPILLNGESGVGKEMFARSLYLLSVRTGQPFLSVNCAQFQSEELLVSELFGHTAGAFTGATTDRAGLFEQADGGVVFLDEVGEGEILPLGASTPRYVNVRTVAATNRDLTAEVDAGRFRTDLFYRLCYLHLPIPPLRERGDDWQLILEDYLDDLNYEHGFTDAASQRLLTPAAVDLLATYHWPGNVRELHAVADVGFCLAPGAEIGPEHVRERLDVARTLPVCVGDGLRTAPVAVAAPGPSGPVPERPASPVDPGRSSSDSSDAPSPSDTDPLARHHAMEAGETDFWTAIRAPYLDREINRAQVQAVIARGLRTTGGSYKRLLPIYGIDEDDYLKFMDFLRHHRLKPPQPW